METAGRRPSPQRHDRVGVGVRGDRLPHQRGSHQTGARKRADENGPHVVSRKAGEHRASHAPHALCPAAQSGTKTGSDQTGSVIQFSSPQPQAAQALAEELMALASEQGFVFLLAQETFRRGWDMVEQGQGEEGMAQMHRGLTAMRVTGTEPRGFVNLALLANAYGKVGQPEEGLRLLAAALARMYKTDAFVYAAGLYRLTGELLLQQSKVQDRKTNDEEAERSFQHAIEIARKQQAKSLELRAVMSLTHLWQQQGKKDEARQMLAEIYGWFTEGFDTKDLQEAKVLLAELTEGV